MDFSKTLDVNQSANSSPEKPTINAFDQKPESMNYKFLLEKDMQKIKARDRKFREEHKDRKFQMRNLLHSAATLEENLLPMQKDRKSIKKLLTSAI